MPNDSTTGGYLAPLSNPAPLEGRDLLRFFQQIIVGITGLDAKLVRPFWQAEPPDIPDEGTVWQAFRVVRKPSDEYPFNGRYPWQNPNDLSIKLQRHEQLDISVTTYDLGSTGLADGGYPGADYYAALLRDGLAIAQNREQLFLTGMGLIKIGDLVTVPEIFKQRWQYRVDFEFTVSRQIDRVYPVTTIVSANGTIDYDTGLPAQTWKAP